jgi:hypothetical protein
MTAYMAEDGTSYPDLASYQARRIVTPQPQEGTQVMTPAEAREQWERLKSSPKWCAEWMAGEPEARDQKLALDKAMLGEMPTGLTSQQDIDAWRKQVQATRAGQ